MGIYIRLGSTNRKAGPETIAEIHRLFRNVSFDEGPCTGINSEAVDFRAASEFFAAVGKQLTRAKCRHLGLITVHHGRELPAYGAVLLFGKKRNRLFPHATVRCAKFAGTTKTAILDQIEIDEYLPRAADMAISFLERHTQKKLKIGRLIHQTITEYPSLVVREAIINAIVHADYSMSSGVQIAIFDDRIELTSPGGLPFGMTLEAALSGVSRLRNRVIGRVFRELQLIEQWGSGISRMITVCHEEGIKTPKFEECGSHFRVTLFKEHVSKSIVPQWHKDVVMFISRDGQISTKDAAILWKVSDRAARSRLRALVIAGVLAELGTGPKDPYRVYILKQKLDSL